jgi:hypothetical protein
VELNINFTDMCRVRQILAAPQYLITSLLTKVLYCKFSTFAQCGYSSIDQIRTIAIAMPRTTAARTNNITVVLAVVHNKVDRRVSSGHWAQRTRSTLSYLVPGVGRHKYGVPDSDSGFSKLGLPERDLAATTFAIKDGIAEARGLRLGPRKGSCRMVFPDENGVNVQCLDQTHLMSECPHHKQLNAQTTQIADLKRFRC